MRLFLVTNRILSSRVDGREAGQLEGVPITYSVWDLGRLHRFITSGHEREDYMVNLNEFGAPLTGVCPHTCSRPTMSHTWLSFPADNWH